MSVASPGEIVTCVFCYFSNAQQNNKKKHRYNLALIVYLIFLTVDNRIKTENIFFISTFIVSKTS